MRFRRAEYGPQFPWGPMWILEFDRAARNSVSVGTYRSDFYAADASACNTSIPFEFSLMVRWPPALGLLVFKKGFTLWLGFVGVGSGFVVLDTPDARTKTYAHFEWPKWRLGINGKECP